MVSSCRARAESMAAISSPNRTSSIDRVSRSAIPTRRAAQARSVSAVLLASRRSETRRSCGASAAISPTKENGAAAAPDGARYSSEAPDTDADVEAIQAPLCRCPAPAPSGSSCPWKKSSMTGPAAGQPGESVHLENLRFSGVLRTPDRLVWSGRHFIHSLLGTPRRITRPSPPLGSSPPSAGWW